MPLTALDAACLVSVDGSKVVLHIGARMVMEVIGMVTGLHAHSVASVTGGPVVLVVG